MPDNRMDDRTYELLLTLAGDTRRLPDDLALDGRGFARDTDAGLLVDMALREGLGGILYRRLKGHPIWNRLPDDRRWLLQQVYYATVQKNLRLIRALSEILEPLNADKIPVMLLQGISLLTHEYPDIGLRALTDIDLWVPPEKFAGFAKCMRQLGYRPTVHYPQTFRRDATIVDVHTHLFWADRIQARDCLLGVDQKTMIESSDPLAVEGKTAYRLAPADQFIYLALHCLKHFAQRLIWLVDIVHLVDGWEGAKWKALRERADTLGQNHTAQYLLFLLADTVRYRPPEDWTALFDDRPLKSWERAVLRSRRKHGALPAWSPLLLLPAGLNPAKKCRFMIESLFPKPSVLQQLFSPETRLKNWQLYGLRALQLLSLIKSR